MEELNKRIPDSEGTTWDATKHQDDDDDKRTNYVCAQYKLFSGPFILMGHQSDTTRRGDK